MTYCLNPNCPNPGDALNADNRICRHCGSSLVLQERYRILRLLGEGGFAKTFEIFDENNQTKVLKVLTDTKTKAIALFELEAKVLAALDHPGIPKVEADGYFTYYPRHSTRAIHCLVMEKIEGMNLEEWYYRQEKTPPPEDTPPSEEHHCLSETQAIDWLKQVVEILEKVHASQYFHRDIKPSNIMLRPTGQLVLIDFGSVREVTGTYLAKVGGGVPKVTGIISPGYTPPEQAKGKALPQSDFFALGRTFVFLLTGSDPNELPENPRTGEIIWHDKAPHISPHFARLIDDLMANLPGNRPQNTNVILQRLNQPPPTPIRTVLPPPPPPTVPLASQPPSRRKRSSHRNSTRRISPQKLRTLLLLFLLAGGLGILLWALGSEIYDALSPQFNLSNPNNKDLSQPLKTTPWKKPTLINTLNNHISGIKALALTPDGKTLISAGIDKTLNLWNLSNPTPPTTIRTNNGEILTLAVSPDGNTIASGSSDKTIKLWDIPTGTLKQTLTGHNGSIYTLAFSPDGKTLASGSADSQIKLWDLATNQQRATLNSHTDGITALAYKPATNLLISAGGDGELLMWDTSSGCPADTCKPVFTFDNQYQPVEVLTIAPQGQILATGGTDGRISLWNLNTGKREHIFTGHTDKIKALAITPNGQTIISGAGSLDSNLRLWNITNGQSLGNVKAHIDSINALAITPDAKTLISASDDTTIKIWQINQP